MVIGVRLRDYPAFDRCLNTGWAQDPPRTYASRVAHEREKPMVGNDDANWYDLADHRTDTISCHHRCTPLLIKRRPSFNASIGVPEAT